ncbi:MAG: hypothetical protein CMK70_13500 [Pseudohongiella sp.]|nr:hypothetical protein [Pseudohongiella sp.]|tara:strand:- start:23281 stop:24054 length:774 start_codon:yes stop_codon:yes gene_type:complete
MQDILYAAELCVEVYSHDPIPPHQDIRGVIEIRDTATGADGFAFVSRQTRTLHIVFRGSQSLLTSDGRLDWFHNVLVKKREWSGIRAHGGVVRCVSAIMPRLIEVLDAFPGFAITLQGHSAGGNIATLVAVALCRRYQRNGEQQLRLITFGQSRVAAAADLKRTIWCDYIRVQNGSDAVCRWPKIGYGDAGRNLYYPNSAKLGDYMWDPTAWQQTRDILFTTIGRVLDHRMSEYAHRTFDALAADQQSRVSPGAGVA